jgi:hypothetical protein
VTVVASGVQVKILLMLQDEMQCYMDGYFSCVNLLITISFCICISRNLFSCHFHLVCCLCIVHDLNVSFHCVVQWVFISNNYLKESAEKFLIKLMKISNVKQLQSYIRPLTKALCFG